MTRFLSGADLSHEIRSILAESGSKAAVAFWGRGGEEWVAGSNSKIVANLSMGGTNPFALRKVQAEIRQCDTLHAKVYIGRERAVIASANASINGLALQGPEQANWIEAGVMICDTEEVEVWFDRLWSELSLPITDSQWKEAERLWKLRARSYKPSVVSFADFDTTARDLPIVTFVGEGEAWTTNEQAVQDAIGAKGPVAQRRVEDGLWVIHKDDRPILLNRWVLVWQKLRSGRPSKRSPWFLRMSDIVVDGGFCWDADGEPQDVVLASESRFPPPFDPSELDFREAFVTVTTSGKFGPLLDDDVSGEPWYKPRQRITRRFWTAVKSEYDRLQETK